LDGSCVIGLVLDTSQELTLLFNSFIGAFYNCRISADTDVLTLDINYSKPDMVLFVSKDLLDSGVWQVVKDNVKNVRVKKFLNPAKLKSMDFIGVDVIGSKNIVDAFNILNNLSPNIFGIEGYLESLLYQKGAIERSAKQTYKESSVAKKTGGFGWLVGWFLALAAICAILGVGRGD